MTYEESALLDAIDADPEDDLPRLVYADWLEGEGLIDRADAIRRGVKKPKRFTFGEGLPAHLGYTSDRVETGGTVQLTLVRGYPGVSWQTYKGMIDSLFCTWPTWLRTGSNVLDRNRVPEVVLTTIPDLVLSIPNEDGIRTVWHSAEWSRGFRKERKVHRFRDGENGVAVYLIAEWSQVKRWIVPEAIADLVWMNDLSESGEDEDNPRMLDPHRTPQVGERCRTVVGREGILVYPVNAHGFGCVRSVK